MEEYNGRRANVEKVSSLNGQPLKTNSQFKSLDDEKLPFLLILNGVVMATPQNFNAVAFFTMI